jgi:tight adherence protein C
MSVAVLLGSGSVTAGVVSLSVLLGTTRGRTPSARQHRRRSKAMLGNLNVSTTDLREALLEKSAGDRLLKPGVAALARRGRRLTPAGMVSALERRIELAAAEEEWPIERALAAKVVLGALGTFMGAVLFLQGPSPAMFLVALFFAGMGYMLPDTLLYNRSLKRQQAMQLELADALDQITITVEAGLGFEAAIDRLSRAGDTPLKRELGRLIREIRLGVSRRQALENLVRRTQVADLRKFVHAIAQADVYGIPIAQVLRVQSGELRAKRRQVAEEKAMKVPVKIMMPLVLCILPSLFIVILGPAGLRLVETFSGG